MFNEVVIVRGGGDIASGAIQKLHRSGFKVLVTEIENPTSIRRKVCFSEAVYDGRIEIEGIRAIHVKNLDEIENAWESKAIAVIIDPECKYREIFQPRILVDAILAKKNMGTNRSMAPITVALGPGFEAGKDVDVVVETNRGHNLARLIFEGKAAPDTGAPGSIGGYTLERVIYSPAEGLIKNIKSIGDIVKADEIIAYVGEKPVKSIIEGVLRGLIRDGSKVSKGLKIADVDPRVSEQKNCFTISDKSRNVGGAVLEAVLYMRNIK